MLKDLGSYAAKTFRETRLGMTGLEKDQEVESFFSNGVVWPPRPSMWESKGPWGLSQKMNILCGLIPFLYCNLHFAVYR